MPDGRWLPGLLMTLLLLTGGRRESVGAAPQPATRGRPGWLPGLAAAAKEQRAHHDSGHVSRRHRGARAGPAARQPATPPRERPAGFRVAEVTWPTAALRPYRRQ